MSRKGRRLARAGLLAVFLAAAFFCGQPETFRALTAVPTPVPFATPVPTPAPMRPASGETPVWLSPSGSRYHKTAGCNGMKAPRETTLEQAEAAGSTPCQRCWK